MPTELEIAEQMRDGLLPSPQKIGTMYLWDVRISGVGAAYRAGLKENVWRDPEIFLSPTMVRRCNGLPLIFVHPDAAKLNSKEYGERSIGSIMLPFVKGKELRGIARVYDAQAIELMKKNQLSTSPGVVFSEMDGSQTYNLPDGETLYVEGDPSLLDHLAVLNVGQFGVWDKTGPASGVLTTSLTEGTTMTDAEKAAADAAKLDAMLSGINTLATRFDSAMQDVRAVNARLDAMEAMDKARKDAEAVETQKREEEKARVDRARKDMARKDRWMGRKDGEDDSGYKKRLDAAEEEERKDAMEEGCDETTAMDRAKKARKDAETAEEKRALEMADREKERNDAAALIAQNTDLVKRLAAVEALMTREVPANERDALARTQARADSVACLTGERVAAPLPGETALAYRKRTLERFKSFSPTFKESRFDAYDDAALSLVEERIYNDAAEAFRKPATAQPGILFPMIESDSAGRQITRYGGDPNAWMSHFKSHPQSGRFVQKGN